MFSCIVFYLSCVVSGRCCMMCLGDVARCVWEMLHDVVSGRCCMMLCLGDVA